jgi:lipid II:glycine glycyltransferase (peptidoglycan interpeptide bridge formation enzyme)|tara:strand:- start:18450 stop:18638 length:189 start_codon:yes stop_codon:yes gene_type:complete
MPSLNIDENIKKIRMNIEELSQEVFRLQGMLSTFESFKKAGLKDIQLPEEDEQLDNTQEKPE